MAKKKVTNTDLVNEEIKEDTTIVSEEIVNEEVIKEDSTTKEEMIISDEEISSIAEETLINEPIKEDIKEDIIIADNIPVEEPKVEVKKPIKYKRSEQKKNYEEISVVTMYNPNNEVVEKESSTMTFSELVNSRKNKNTLGCTISPVDIII